MNKRVIITILVIIFIAASLMWLILAMMSSSKIKNDEQRLSDILQIQTALEQYYYYNNNYPLIDDDYIELRQGAGLALANSQVGFVFNASGADEILLAPVPSDPDKDKAYYYFTNQNGDNYYLQFSLDRFSSLWQCGGNVICYATQGQVGSAKPF